MRQQEVTVPVSGVTRVFAPGTGQPRDYTLKMMSRLYM